MNEKTRDRLMTGVAVAVGAILSSALVWQASTAAFSATTKNPGNAWTASSVALTDDDGGGPTAGTAMFSATGLTGGDSGSNCITVTYNGDVTVPVKLYGADTSGSLGDFLDLTIEEGTGGGFGDCDDFVADSTIYSDTIPVASDGTIGDFGATRTSYETGVGTWTPTGATQYRVYKFSYTLRNDPAAMGKSAGVTFVWEAKA